MSTSQAGKGDAPRNLSEKFRTNYDLIDWGKKKKDNKKKSVGKFKKTYQKK